METILANVKKSVLSDRLAYRLMESTGGLIKQRNQVFVKSDVSEYTGSGTEIMKFIINNQGFLDGRNSYLSFVFKTSSVRYGVRGSLSRMISKVRLTSTQDGTTISDISDVNVFQHLLKENTLSDMYKKTKGTVENYRSDGYVDGNNVGTAAFRAQMAAETQYCLDLSFIPALFNEKLLPMRAFKSLTLEITLADARQVLQYHKEATANPGNTAGYIAAGGGAVPPGYTVKKAELCLDMLHMSDIVNQAVDSLANEGKVLVPIKEVFCTTSSGGNNGSDISIQLSKPVFENQSVMAVFRETANLNNPDADSFNSIAGTNVEQYQWNHASIYYPSRPISGMAEQFLESQRAWNQLNNIHYSTYGIDDFKGVKHFIGLECERDASSTATGLSSKFNQNIGLNYKLNAGAPASSLTFVLLYLKTVTIGPNGSLTVSE